MTAQLAAVLGFLALASQAFAQTARPTVTKPDLTGLSFARLPFTAVEGRQTVQPAGGRDSVLNGVLIGAAIGGLLGLVPDHYDDCEECHDSLYGSIAAGAGIGLVVDLLRNDRRPVSPTQSGRTLRVDAAVTRARLGFGGTIRWR